MNHTFPFLGVLVFFHILVVLVRKGLSLMPFRLKRRREAKHGKRHLVACILIIVYVVLMVTLGVTTFIYLSVVDEYSTFNLIQNYLHAASK